MDAGNRVERKNCTDLGDSWRLQPSSPLGFAKLNPLDGCVFEHLATHHRRGRPRGGQWYALHGGNQVAAGLAHGHRGTPGADRPTRLRRTALHPQDGLGASPGSLADSLARQAPRLATGTSGAAGGGDRVDDLSAAQPESGQPDGHRPHGRSAGPGECHPGHPGGRLPHGPAARTGAGRRCRRHHPRLPRRHAGHRRRGLHPGRPLRLAPGLRRLGAADAGGDPLHPDGPQTAADPAPDHQPAPGGAGAGAGISTPQRPGPGRDAAGPGAALPLARRPAQRDGRTLPDPEGIFTGVGGLGAGRLGHRRHDRGHDSGRDSVRQAGHEPLPLAVRPGGRRRQPVLLGPGQLRCRPRSPAAGGGPGKPRRGTGGCGICGPADEPLQPPLFRHPVRPAVRGLRPEPLPALRPGRLCGRGCGLEQLLPAHRGRLTACLPADGVAHPLER